jgi:hypothetical protein
MPPQEKSEEFSRLKVGFPASIFVPTLSPKPVTGGRAKVELVRTANKHSLFIKTRK